VKPLLRLVAGVAALLVLSLSATACDTSPTAVVVNSQTIKQAALYSELHAWAANRAYVNVFNAAYASPGSTGETVAGPDNPHTYSTAWVANILSGMVIASLIHQDSVSTGREPSATLVDAARAVSEIGRAPYWDQFSPTFRQILTTRLAEQAAISPVSVSTSTLQSLYTQYRTYFFGQVCLREAAAFSLAQAQIVAAGGVGGTVVCYDQAQFEQQPAAFQTEVRGLAVGATGSPLKTTFGYQVLTVTSRQVLGFGPAVQRALSVVYITAEGLSDPVLSSLLSKAHVKVNPAFGTWQGQQVTPPTQPTI
jgi:hypothetical protein